MGITNQKYGMWYVVEVLFVAHMILLYLQLAWLAKDVWNPKKANMCILIYIYIYTYIYMHIQICIGSYRNTLTMDNEGQQRSPGKWRPSFSADDAMMLFFRENMPKGFLKSRSRIFEKYWNTSIQCRLEPFSKTGIFERIPPDGLRISTKTDGKSLSKSTHKSAPSQKLFSWRRPQDRM